MSNRMVSWWLGWDDLKWPDNDIYDKIRRRADLMQKSEVNAAIIFGTHFRWDFMPIWDCVHDLIRTVADELHQRNIKLFDHHSAVLVHRHNTMEEMRDLKVHSGPHLPLSPSYKAAASWSFNGALLNDWRMSDALTDKPVYLPHYAAEQFCYNNPSFIEAYLEYIKLLIKETNVDGLMCDDALFFGGYSNCACESCRSKFRNLYGHELPAVSDLSFWGNWKNQAWRDWLEMRFASNGDFLAKVRSVLPDNFPMMSCCSGSVVGYNNHRAQDIRQFNRGCNMVHLELCGNTPPLNDSDTVNFGIAHKMVQSSHHLAAADEKGFPCIGLGFGFTEASANIVWALNKTLGSDCWFSTLKGRLGLVESEIEKLPDDPEIVAKAFTFESEHEELFATKPVSQTGVYFSYNTRNNSLFGDVENGYAQDFNDTLTALFSAGIPVETLLKLPVSPEKISLVLLPSLLCLSEEERVAIKHYMKSGGKVIATGPCGLCDGSGNKSKNSFLNEYDIDINFIEPEMSTDFWGMTWRDMSVAACDNSPQWHKIGENFFWHPMRLQDNNPPGIIDKVKSFKNHLPLEIVKAQGYLSVLRQAINDDSVFVLQMLAAKYDVKVDDELEAKRKHRSRINYITEAKPENVTRKIVLALNSEVEDIKVFMPFNENEKAKIICEDLKVNIFLPENCSYFICKIKLKVI